MNKLYVSAAIEMTEGKEVDYVKEQLLELQQATIQESGNIQFEILHDKENPQRFLLWECWHGAKDLDNHFQQEHTKAYLAKNLTDVVYIEKLNKL